MRGVITGLKAKKWAARLFRAKKRRQIDFSPHLYLGDGIEKDGLEKLKKRLCRKPLLTSVCLLVLSENESDQLDIVDSKQLAQPFYDGQTLHVAGVARTKDDAVSLVMKMAEECLAAREDCSLKEFLAWHY